MHTLFFSPTVLVRDIHARKKSIGAAGHFERAPVSRLVHRQQLQLLGNSRNETLEYPDLFVDVLVFAMPPAIRDQPLYSVSGEVGDTARARFFANADELPEFVLRDPKID
jgi:hypothetical protein